MKTCKTIKVFGVSFGYYNNAGFRMVTAGKKVWFLSAPKWYVNAKQFVRGFLPAFYAVGLRDCDTGGRVHRWYLTWSFMERRFPYEEWDKASDGPPAISELGIIKFIKARIEYGSSYRA